MPTEREGKGRLPGEVVVSSAEELRRLERDLTGRALIAALRASPHDDVEIEPERGPLPVRAVVL